MVGAQPFIPLATYRLQLRPEFGYDDVAAIAGYLAELGVTHVYTSPFLQAAKGSTHGYDVADHSRVSRDLGGPQAHQRMIKALRENNLGLVVDIVPNHMDIESPDNVWWADVLKNGRASRFADFFDIDWQGPHPTLHDKVLVPVLGDHFGRIIEKRDLSIARSDDDFYVRYYDKAFPVAPESLEGAFAAAAQNAASDLLAFVADALADSAEMPFASDHQRVRRERRQRVLMSLVARMLQDPALAKAIDDAIGEINSDPDLLERFLRNQHYRLAFWRIADTELNYRRFFNIVTLVGLRMEDEKVFEQSHALILGWVRDATIQGIRVDHPDGLRNPEQYLLRLRNLAPNAWIIVEKILELHEPLPPSWPVHGTTGYDFMNRVAALFIDAQSEEALTDFYHEFTMEPTSYIAVLREKKLLILERTFNAELDRLAGLLADICERHRRHRDYALRDLVEAIREMVVAFPVYRSYVRPDSEAITETDKAYITNATETAKVFRPDLDAELFDFISDILMLRHQGRLEEDFVFRFQQFTSPLMAKGAEDTAFYCYNRLISLNEVGGDPAEFGISPEQFHAVCRQMLQSWPYTMTSTSTHDSKRSEDTRARINLISEIPQAWFAAVRRWAEINAPHRRSGVPDRNTEYFLYQTLLGAWPIEIERAISCMDKATREAKMKTSWEDPNPVYDVRFKDFLKDILNDRRFTADLDAFVAPLVQPARITSLAQLLIKMTAPGVPDIYQGNEIWNLALMDPDNRRPVDYKLRLDMLARIQKMTVKEIIEAMDQGLPKLFVTQKALRLRRRLPEVFSAKGAYVPLLAQGAKANHLFAFERGGRVITAVPRLLIGLANDWQATAFRLPPGNWKNEFTGDPAQGEIPAQDLFSRFPVAMLVKE